MLESEARRLLAELIEADPLRRQALDILAQVALPEGLIAAGFVRNLAWDFLHQLSAPTALADIDVVYFDRDNCSAEIDRDLELTFNRLSAQLEAPVRWQVRNQARMHCRNGDSPYTSAVNAMAYWPERETAIGVARNVAGTVEFFSPFANPISQLMQANITWNPARQRSIFHERLVAKQWLCRWPNLTVVDPEVIGN